ncbi:hypothetical protein NP493_48g06000 [Ridgeia piscesae]|uniref:Ig-like domain-containing protein n=1 Tax=Ridgeia piscesae TaxID=27915 RepID=A0AAD9PBG5_RIDPI|nr:hypothetical protein NP493_48g06000 [Ridgeia piscesae]
MDKGIGTLETGLEFITQPDDVIAVRNRALWLNCTAVGSVAVEADVKAENITYTWLKDSQREMTGSDKFFQPSPQVSRSTEKFPKHHSLCG